MPTTKALAAAAGQALFNAGADRYRETFERPGAWSYNAQNRSYHLGTLCVRATYDLPHDEGLIVDADRLKELAGAYCTDGSSPDQEVHVSLSRVGHVLSAADVENVTAAFLTRHGLVVAKTLDQLGSYEADAHRSTILHLFAAGPLSA